MSHSQPAIDPEVFATNHPDPYPTFQAMRARCPVRRDELTGAYLVANYDGVFEVLNSDEKFSSRAYRLGEMVAAARAGKSAQDYIGEPRRRAIVHDDDPYHALIRKVVARSFTPRAIATLEPTVRDIAIELLGAVRTEEPIDFVRAFAEPMPCRVISSMYGVPPDEYPTFKVWLDGVLNTDPAVHLSSTAAFNDYMAPFIEARRRSPKDDMITHIVNARDPEGKLLAEEEIFNLLLSNILAGHETTTNLLTNTMWLLADRQDLWEEARDDRALVPRIIEESLRIESPLQWMPRTAREDVDIQGVAIPCGATVVPMQGSANRDEHEWDNPADFDPKAERATRHLAFGVGKHFCLGAALARLEGVVALNLLLDRFRGFELSGEPQRSTLFLGVRGFAKLPVTFHA
jgi:cytochrome P450